MVRDSMATFYLDAAFISACTGGSAVRAAAYRHAVRMVSHAFTETTSFTHKAQAMVHAEIALPEDAPDWAENAFGRAAFADALRLVRADVQAQDLDMSEAAMQRAAMARVSEQLWNAVEHGEHRLNIFPTRAQYARSLTVALPRELDQAAQIALMQGYVRASFSDRGMVADWVIHDKSDGNPHAHIMLTTRDLGAADWGRKRCDWNARDVLSGLRSDWAQHANLALERGGFDERIDHRSNHARGIYLEPDSYNPHVANHARRQGEIAREANRCSDVADANALYLQQHPEHILVVVQAQRAVFTRGDIVAAFEDRLMLTETELAGLVAEAMGSGAAVRLVQNSPDGQAQYVTTARASEMQRLETLARAMAIAGPAAGLGPTAPGIGLLTGTDLTPDQRVAAEAMLSPAPLTLVKGYAGTGKTFTLGEVARVWQARGYEVLGGAASGKATQELGGIKGMRTASLAAWDARWSRGEAPKRDRFVFIMDEAGMVGAGQWARIAGVVSAMGGKLIAVGDPEQLQPVSDLPGWAAAERGVSQATAGAPVVALSSVRRQRSMADRMATEALARGGAEIAPAIRHYIDKGALRLDSGVLNDPVSALAAAYYKTGPGKAPGGAGCARLALACTNREVWALNDAIRAQALARGEIDQAGIRDYGTITRIDRTTPTHERIAVPLALGPGDRVMLTRPHRALDLPRSAFGTVVATRAGEIDLLVDGSSRAVTLDLGTFRDLDYGYAATIHKSQGVTVDHTLVLGHGRMNRHAVYVALTRHRDSVTVFGRAGHLSCPADLITLAHAPGHLSIDIEDGPHAAGAPGGMVASAAMLGLGARGDWLGSGVSVETGAACGGVSFLGDASLMAVAERVSGLLASDYIHGDPILKSGHDGAAAGRVQYAQDPTRVIDDLIRQRSVFRADVVAGVLSRLVAEPETFLRLFREAMSHRDLVVLAEDGGDGLGRVYSTAAQVRGELAAVDLGTRLALGAAAEYAPALAMTSGDAVDLSAGQRVALAHGCEPGRLRLIRGEAGTGKTLVAARLAAVYRRADWQVVGLTPTGAGLDALRDAGLPGGRTLRQFTRDRGTGRLRLDPGTVVVLDDAGRLGGREAGELLADIEASGTKLIALMDGGLQGPLEAGPVLRAVETRVGSARLEDMHWRTAERVEALRLVAAGDARGVEMLREAEVIQADGTVRGAAAAVALRYLADGQADKIALAWSRAEADLLTRAIRAGLDELHPFRAGFEPETGGAFAGLKPGDRIRFIAAGRWQKDRPAKHAPPRIRAGETAQLVGRDGGRLRLRIDEGRNPQTGRMDVRDVLYAPNSELPDWRFAFAGTIHGEMGRARDSVHLLAAPGLNLHLLDLTVTVPCAAARLGEVMGRILRRTASAPRVIDYGFDASLGAREALRGQVYQEAVGGGRTGTARAVARLRDLAGLAGDPGAAARVLPRGLEGAVLAEVIGAAILHDGAAPEGEDRLAVERVVRDMSDARAWRRVLKRVPSTLPGAADDLAAAVAGRDGAGRLLTPARILARGALTAQAMGEDRVAALFERGLGLYGKRAGAARLLGQPEDLVAPQRDRQMEFAWPDPGLRPERGRSAVIGPPRGQRWRLDIGRLLGDVPRADTIMAEQVLEGLAGMFGLGPRAGRARRPGQHAAGRYAAWQAAERSGGGGYAISAGAGRHATPAEQVPEANRVVAPHRAPVSGPGLHTGPADAEADLPSPVSDYTDGEWQKFLRERQAVIDEYVKEKMAEAEMASEYAGVALQMACALTDRIPADSKVHQLPLQADIARMLKKADACSDLPQEKVNTIAREIAEDRAAFESKIAFARELVAGAPQPGTHDVNPERFHEYMFVAQLRKDSGSDRDGQHPMRLNAGPLQERYTDEVDMRVAADLASGLAMPTKEEHLVARLSLLPDRSEDEARIAAALNEALRWGRPMEGAKLQHERAAVLQGLGSVSNTDRSDARDLLARLYCSHTYREIRALADPERDLPGTMLPIDDAARGAAAHGYAKSARAANVILSGFVWRPHMQQHGLEIEGPSMSDGLGMWM